MNLLEQTRYLIKQTGLKPDKLKGQNFCVDQIVLQKMVAIAGVGKEDTVLEVGPGFGFLTVELLNAAKKVIAVEIEPVLARVLQSLAAVHSNLEIITGDVLKLDESKLPQENYQVVANLPYSITSFFLKKFLALSHKPASLTLLIQKEVAQRICAYPGQMSLLSLSVQLYAQAEIKGFIKPAAFYPSPKVSSAIIHITDLKSFPFADKVEEKFFWTVVKVGFGSKRKTLANNLANSFHQSRQKIVDLLAKVGLKDLVRAQELSASQWADLASELKRLL